MRRDRRTGLSRLPNLRWRVEFRRLGIVRIVILILILILTLLVLLRVLAIRRCLRLARGAACGDQTHPHCHRNRPSLK